RPDPPHPPPPVPTRRSSDLIEELSAQGVTFPVKVQMPYNPSTPDWDRQCQVFKQQLEGVLNDGADFIDVILTAGPADNYLSAVRDRKSTRLNSSHVSISYAV